MIINEPVELEPAAPIKWGFAPSKEKNTPGFWMDFQFKNLKSDDDQEWLTVRKTWWLTDNTLDFFLRDMATIGWTGKNLEELDPNESVAVDLAGHEVLLTIEMRQYGEKMYPEVKFINPLGYAGPRKMESKEVKALSSKLKGKIAAYRAKNGSTVPPQKTQAKKPEPVFASKDNDEIPF